jgi:hypothetical protein
LNEAHCRIILLLLKPPWERPRSLMQICHLKEDKSPEIRNEETRCA